MAKQVVGVGTAPDDNTGDTARVAFTKINDNFTEVYPATVPFVVSIPLTLSKRFMPAQAMLSPVTFTVAANPVAGGECTVRLVASGQSTHLPTFTGFKKYGGSANYDNTVGTVNVIEFWHDGTDAWYMIQTEQPPVAIATPTQIGITGNTLTLTFGGRSLATGAGNTPAASAFSLVLNGTARVVSSPTVVNATTVTLTFDGAAGAAGQTGALTYTKPVSNFLRDTNNVAVENLTSVPFTLASALLLDQPELSTLTIPLAFSLRKLRDGVTNCIRVRTANVAEADIGFDSSGNLNLTQLAPFIADAPIFVRTWYNQGTQAGAAYNFGMDNPGLQPTLEIDTDTSNDRYVIRSLGGVGGDFLNMAVTDLDSVVLNPRTGTTQLQLGSFHLVARSADGSTQQVFGVNEASRIMGCRMSSTLVDNTFENQTAATNVSAHTGWNVIMGRRTDNGASPGTPFARNFAQKAGVRTAPTYDSGDVQLTAAPAADIQFNEMGLFVGRTVGATQANAKVAELILCRTPANDTQANVIANNQDAYWVG